MRRRAAAMMVLLLSMAALSTCLGSKAVRRPSPEEKVTSATMLQPQSTGGEAAAVSEAELASIEAELDELDAFISDVESGEINISEMEALT